MRRQTVATACRWSTSRHHHPEPGHRAQSSQLMGTMEVAGTPTQPHLSLASAQHAQARINDPGGVGISAEWLSIRHEGVKSTSPTAVRRDTRLRLVVFENSVPRDSSRRRVFSSSFAATRHLAIPSDSSPPSPCSASRPAPAQGDTRSRSMRNRRCCPTKVNPSPSSSRKYSRRWIKAASRSDSEYSSLRSRNSSTYGSLMASLGVMASSGLATAP